MPPLGRHFFFVRNLPFALRSQQNTCDKPIQKGPSMQEIVNFILELDKLKSVTRKVRPIGLDRYENSAEHSWQIALMAASLAQYAASSVDINHVVSMLLVHDIGEIDAGDTMVFVEGGWEQRKAAELASVTRIFGLLPDSQGAPFLALWQEFEDAATPESRFAHSVDRAMPVLLNLANHGQSWRENGISYERVVRRVEPEVKAGCPALWEYLRSRLESVREKGYFGA
jgi:putative hydrolase of HD superfamily